MAAYVDECGQLGIPYIYDPSQQIVRLEAEVLREGIAHGRALFCNDYEFGLISEKVNLGLDAILEQVGFLVITRGEHGADVYQAGQMLHIPAVPPQKMADPTGVGDAFRGGFLKGYAHGIPLERCGQMGALAATCALKGTRAQFRPGQFMTRFRGLFDGGRAEHSCSPTTESQSREPPVWRPGRRIEHRAVGSPMLGERAALALSGRCQVGGW
jgi:adenosine kinase